MISFFRGDRCPLTTFIFVKGDPTQAWPVDDTIIFRFTLKANITDPDSAAIVSIDSVNDASRFNLDDVIPQLSWDILPSETIAKYPGPLSKSITLEADLQYTDSNDLTKVYTLERFQMILNADVSITSP